jgi:hypothetical protein
MFQEAAQNLIEISHYLTKFHLLDDAFHFSNQVTLTSTCIRCGFAFTSPQNLFGYFLFMISFFQISGRRTEEVLVIG